MTDQKKPPILPFELEPEKVTRTAPVARPQQAPPKAAEPKPAKSWRGRVMGALIIGIVGLIGVQAVSHVTDMIANKPLLGWPFLALLLVVAGSTVSLFAREVLDIRSMHRRERLRSSAERLAKSDLHGEADGLVAELSTMLDAPAALNTYRENVRDDHSDGERLVLLERHVIAPLDKRAYRLVLEGSRDIGLLTALSPLGLLDGLLVIWRNLVMIRQIARLYGLAMGPTASLSLLRRCLRNAAIAGIADVVSHATIEHVGASITAMLSARAGQGAGNALLAARLGIEAIRQARPLPYIAQEQPRLRHVREAIFEKGELDLGEKIAEKAS